MKPRFVLVAAMLTAAAAHATTTAWLSQNAIGAGDTVQLTLEHDGQGGGQPALAPLAQDFDILARSSGSSIQINNGTMTSSKQLVLTLAPKHGGTLTIPALAWGSERTPVLTLKVAGNGSAAPSGNAVAGGNSHLFFTTTLDQKQPYVQAAVALTIRLYVDIPLSQASLDLPASNDVLVQQLGQDTQTQVVRNGQPYDMIERKYLLFPQKSGTLKLDGPVLEGLVPDPRSSPFGNDPFFNRGPFAAMMNPSRPVHLRGDAITLKVRPRPASWRGSDWLPAQQVALDETWQPDAANLHAGAPITRQLSLSAVGLTAAQLPDISKLMVLPQGLRAYPDQATLKTGLQGATVRGERTQNVALIANLPGTYAIPALHLAWWDTTTNSQREVTLPARTLHVLPGAGGIAASTTPPTQAMPPSPPPVGDGELNNVRMAAIKDALVRDAVPFAALLALIALSAAAIWGNKRRRKAANVAPDRAGTAGAGALAAADLRRAREDFRQACRDNDAAAARRNLLAWAHATWPDEPPVGIKGLIARLDDAASTPLLLQLDRACYAGGDWHGAALQEALKPLTPSRRTKPAVSGLADLYT